MTPYQYVLLRYCPNQSAGELVNVGLLFWLPCEKRLLWRVSRNFGRLSRFLAEFDGDAYRTMVDRFASRCENLVTKLSDPQPDLFDSLPSDLGSLASLLKQEDASALRWSDVRGGIAEDIEDRLERLWDEFISRHCASHERQRRDEKAVLQRVVAELSTSALPETIHEDFEVKGTNYSHTFHYHWQNGKPQVLDTISFDLVEPARIRDKANTWAGRLLALSRDNIFEMTSVVAVPASDKALRDAYEDAVAMLREAPSMRTVIREDEIVKLPGIIARDLAESGRLP